MLLRNWKAHPEDFPVVEEFLLQSPDTGASFHKRYVFFVK